MHARSGSSEYGGVDVLDVVDVEPPELGDGQTAGAGQGDRDQPVRGQAPRGLLRGDDPAELPGGAGDRLRRRRRAALDRTSTTSRPGMRCWERPPSAAARPSSRVASQARALPRPAALPWEVAGGLWTVGTTAYAAVDAVDPSAGDLVVVAAGLQAASAALAAQLARQRGATVLGVAAETSHDWLRSRDMHPGRLRRRARRAAQASRCGGRRQLDRADRHRRQRLRALAIELGIAPDAHRHDRRLRRRPPATAPDRRVPAQPPPPRSSRSWCS